ncbi:MAG: RDD family protein [Aeromicrobium sp.]|uniref:RDD family protein n=1 Tax=Aeromicrobium sp. TaxID=1871063 RepID=UPI0039E667DE
MSNFPPPAATGQPAEWVQRFLAYLIDMAPFVVVYLVGIILDGIAGTYLFTPLTFLAGFAWIIFNYGVKQGTTGYTVGKAVIGIKLVDGKTGQPVGTGMAIARYFVHLLDALPCYIGFLFPLWDAKKETFADKILTHAVVVAPKVDPKGLILGN